MRKLIAAINMTLDGYCDHTAINPDEEIHQHYSDLINNGGMILYGRITYQLMEYWRDVLKNPAGNKQMDEFAIAIDRIPKIVFSHTLKNVDWESASLAKRDLKEEIISLKQEEGRDILVGSPGLIVSAMNLNLVDELQLCIHPVVVASGLPLFKNTNGRSEFKLTKSKTFSGGAIILYYQPVKPKPGDQ